MISLFARVMHGQVSTNDITIDYSSPKEYEIGGITVSGTKTIDPNVLIMLSGLAVGDQISIPGDEVSKAIQNLWKQGFFENISISVKKIQGNLAFLNIHLNERPRLSYFKFEGVKKTEADDIRDQINIMRGDVVTENLKLRIAYKIKKYFIDKGFLNINVNIEEKPQEDDDSQVALIINIDKGKKVKVNRIYFHGNNHISDLKLKNAMKNTKEKFRIHPLRGVDIHFLYTFTKNILHNTFSPHTINMDDTLKEIVSERIKVRLKASKFIPEDYKNDKFSIIERYNEEGFRDAKLIEDTVYKAGMRGVNIELFVDEGSKYYYRNIDWVGNTVFTDDELNAVLNIEKGDVYNQKRLITNMEASMDGRDIQTMYMDKGYLFFQITPVEINVENDSIDMEMRIYEGKPARIRKVIITGNTKTHDKVIYREIRTRPGQLFSKSNIIRSQRELAQLRYFDMEKMAVNPKPNPQDGTVDIEYQIEETSSDQLELSGGWGAGRFVGTFRVSFNNFSLQNIFNPASYNPIPSGSGQRLSVSMQANAKYYQSYGFSFTEPWLGGKKPNALTLGYYYSIQRIYGNYYDTDSDEVGSLKIHGINIGLGQRLEWPDDYFNIYYGLSLQTYKLKNYGIIRDFNNGDANNFSANVTLGRSSIDHPIFPTMGSEVSLSLQLTPPYSLFSDKDYSSISAQEKYKFIEYHKWKFKLSYYTTIVDKLVLNAKSRFGMLAYYNKDLGYTPFERFYVGGDGLSGYSIDGRELIGLRGYGNNSLTPEDNSGRDIGGTIFDKFTLELKYPLSMNPMSSIFLLTFVEAGNTWSGFREFDVFDMKRSAGVGIRLYLPMLGGLLGLDWGYGFDEIYNDPNANKGQFHFSINQSID